MAACSQLPQLMWFSIYRSSENILVWWQVFSPPPPPWVNTGSRIYRGKIGKDDIWADYRFKNNVPTKYQEVTLPTKWYWYRTTAILIRIVPFLSMKEQLLLSLSLLILPRSKTLMWHHLHSFKPQVNVKAQISDSSNAAKLDRRIIIQLWFSNRKAIQPLTHCTASSR